MRRQCLILLKNRSTKLRARYRYGLKQIVRVDAMEPLLGPLSSLLINGNLCFQLRNPTFGGTQLIRELLRYVHRTPAVSIGNISRFVQKLEDGLTGLVEFSVVVLFALSRPCKLNHFGTYC